jgi:hypothetical protein
MADSSPLRRCNACNKPPKTADQKLLACTKCRKVWYHDVACQRQHWKQHKRKCPQLAASYTDGVRVLESGTEGLGRVAVTTKNFLIGDTVLAEPPAIVISEENGYFGLWDSFLEASEDIQQGILEMQHQELPQAQWATDPRQSMIGSELRRYRQSHPENDSRLSDRVARNLVSIVGMNAHAFSAQHTGSMIATPDSMPAAQSALFVISSKIQHSCAPNVTFATTGAAVLEHVAESPIKEGDRLSSCYCDRVYEKPRQERREFLQTNKSFLCECQRCLGPDECVPLRCDHCKTGVLFHNGATETWTCVFCDWSGSNNDNIARQIHKQDGLRQQMDDVQSSLESSGINQWTLQNSMVIQAEIATELHPLHWLHAAYWDLLTTLTASYARLLMKGQGLSPNSGPVVAALRTSGLCQLKRILWVQRNVSVVHGRVTLKDLVTSLDGTVESAFDHNTIRLRDVVSVLDMVVASNPQWHDTTDVAHIAYHAGRDLLLAGDVEVVVKLYTRFQALFPRWKRLSVDDAKKINTLLESNGRDNRFRNHLTF